MLGGSVGIGEVATVPTSPAIANAIRNATGIRLTETADPARPPDRRTEREGRRMTPSSMTAIAPSAEFRAAGTDLSERRRSGVSTGPLIDIAAAPDTIGMHWGADGGVAHRRLHHASPRSPPTRASPRPIRALRLQR